MLSDRNARRTLLGALQIQTGESLILPRLRGRTDDVLALIETLGTVQLQVLKLLIWDNAPPHHPHQLRAYGAGWAHHSHLPVLPLA